MQGEGRSLDKSMSSCARIREGLQTTNKIAQEVLRMDNNSLAHTKWECKYHIGATWRSLFEMRFNAIISIRDIPTTKCPVSDERCEAVGQSGQAVSTSAQLPGMDAQG